MATIATIADDFDGSTPAETMTFTVSGKDYAIDLNEEHAQQLQAVISEFEEKMSPYVAKARPLGKSTTAKATATRAPSYDAKAVREWAEKNNYEVSARGRIRQEVVEAYRNRKR
ncbi:Lsr2 family protein [Micrococcus luteus]|uniref:histone-like nucleoid-structuring protein Lsr2 n=1 Tax=Micrococcus luteus TaxID=1270 RepID=UPI0039A2CAB1